jgi:hypothetical protein
VQKVAVRAGLTVVMTAVSRAVSMADCSVEKRVGLSADHWAAY